MREENCPAAQSTDADAIRARERRREMISARGSRIRRTLHNGALNFQLQVVVASRNCGFFFKECIYCDAV